MKVIMSTTIRSIGQTYQEGCVYNSDCDDISEGQAITFISCGAAELIQEDNLSLGEVDYGEEQTLKSAKRVYRKS